MLKDLAVNPSVSPLPLHALNEQRFRGKDVDKLETIHSPNSKEQS